MNITNDAIVLSQSQEQAQPKFVIADISPSSVSVQPSQQFIIDINVENVGNASGDVEVRLVDHNGSIVDSKTITLDSNQGQVVGLSGVAPSNPGSYSWKVEAYNKSTNNVDDSKTVTISVSTPSAQPAESKKSGFPWWIIILIGGFILLSGREKR